jgi:hypothetical protein
MAARRKIILFFVHSAGRYWKSENQMMIRKIFDVAKNKLLHRMPKLQAWNTSAPADPNNSAQRGVRKMRDYNLSEFVEQKR